MAKLKKQERLGLSLSRDILSSINNEAKFKIDGGKVFYNLKEDKNIGVPQWYVSTGSTSLNLAMTGHPDRGIPSGTIVEMFGLKQSGKSLVALTICREVQRMGGIAVYIDSEQRFFRAFAEAIGLDFSEESELFMYSDVPFLEKVLEAIKYINKKYYISQKKQDNKIPLVFIWDSLHASAPEDEYEEDNVELGGYKTQKARILSQEMQKINFSISRSGASLVILNQLRTNVGAMVGDKYTTTGGMTVEYYSSIRVYLKQKLAYQEVVKDGEIGRNMEAKIVKNSVHRPNLIAQFTVRYDSGIDDYPSFFEMLDKEKLLKKEKSSYVLEYPDPDTQEILELKFMRKTFKDKIIEAGLEDYVKSLVVNLMKFEYKRQDEDNKRKEYEELLKEQKALDDEQ